MQRWGRAALCETCALCLVAVVILVYFQQAIRSGVIAFEKDTEVYYYPLVAWFADELGSGRFPLWNPYIFGGHPSLADGEIGLAYPLQLLLLTLLPTAQAFIWLRISSVLIAAGAMYALARAFHLSRVPAMLSAITFALGSFFLSQIHHENVTRTAAWLPLVLACTEWALHRGGWRRHVFLTLAGLALGMSGLGLHPQVLAMHLLAFSTFVIYRVFVGPVGGRQMTSTSSDRARGLSPAVRLPVGHHLRLGTSPSLSGSIRLLTISGAVITRLALTVWIGAYVGGLGLGLAAVQILPLIEVGEATFRGSSPDYLFATSYAFPVQNLLTLVFPYFFRGPEGDYWSLWAKWETTLYVGILPLVVGIIGALFSRRREALYFLGLALTAVWLAFATYVPFDLYGLLWQVPGFSSFRVPGRYTFLFVLAWAVLAGFGLQILMDRRGSPKWGAPATVGLAATLGLTAIAASVGIQTLRGALEANPTAAIGWIHSSYMSLRHHAEGLEAMDVYRGMMYSLDYANPRTIFSLVALGLTAVMVAGIGLSRRGRTIWALAAFLCTAFDLISFSGSLHQKGSVEDLLQPTPPVQFLADCVTGGAQCGMAGNEWRIFTPGTIASVEFDRLVPFRIPEIGGYSSLESRRSFVYWGALNSAQNQLADLANVRYLVYPAQPPALPSYSHVPFDPDRPLAVASSGSLGDGDSYSFGGVVAHRLQVVAALTHSIDVPQGEVVAEVKVMGQDGSTATIPLRAGREVAEWAYDRPDVVGRMKHERADTVAFRRPDIFSIDGSRYERYLFYSERDLPAAMQVDRVSVHYVNSKGEIEVYGIGLFNFETGATAGATPTMRSKLSSVYRDRDVQIMENRDAFPRAYVVPGAQLANIGASPISLMLDRPFNPTQEVLLEAAAGPSSLSSGQQAHTEGSSAPVTIDSMSQSAVGARQTPVAAVPLSIEPDRVVYRASAPTGGYLVHVATFFPGWRARVDGSDAPILPANALFRAVPLPPGDHVVELRYAPPSVELGLGISVWAATIGCTTVLAAVLAILVQRVLATFRERSPRRARQHRPAAA